MREAQARVTLHIGHEGATDSVVFELREQVKRRKVVKVKKLRTVDTAGPERAFWADLAHRAGVRLLQTVGRTAVFCDPAYRVGTGATE